LLYDILWLNRITRRCYMLRRSGFTLLELMIVVIIIGILSTIALPQFSGMVEKAKSSEAISILGSLRTSGQIYYLEVSQFPGSGWITSEALMASDLGIDVSSSSDWNFSIVTADTVDALLPRYQALRDGSAYAGQTIVLSASGQWTGNHSLRPKQ